jgi:hypothetical protein
VLHLATSPGLTLLKGEEMKFLIDELLGRCYFPPSSGELVQNHILKAEEFVLRARSEQHRMSYQSDEPVLNVIAYAAIVMCGALKLRDGGRVKRVDLESSFIELLVWCDNKIGMLSPHQDLASCACTAIQHAIEHRLIHSEQTEIGEGNVYEGRYRCETLLPSSGRLKEILQSDSQAMAVYLNSIVYRKPEPAAVNEDHFPAKLFL